MHADLSAVQPLDSTPSTPSVPGDERALALIAHLSALVAPLLGPLVAYVVTIALRGPGFARQHAAAALNFGITSALAVGILAALQACLAFAGTVQVLSLELGWGTLLHISSVFFLAILGAGSFTASLVFTICAALAAGRGAPYAYPVSLRLVR